jgi:hypothetical protein
VNVALAEAFLALAGTYLGLGLIFALAFVTRGVGRVDAAAAAGSLGFRLLLVPGSATLWPLLALRWHRAHGAPPEERDAHTIAARGAGA